MRGLCKTLRRRAPWCVATDRATLGQSLRVLIPMHTSPNKIAMGVSVGLVVAFSPLVGFQMGLALVVATILNVSRVTAVATVWVTNPLTMGMIYALTYQIGRPFWFSSPEVAMSQLSETISGVHGPFSVGSVFHAFQSMFSLGLGLWMSMLIGGLIVGGVAACLSYPVVRLSASWYQRVHRRHHRSSRKDRAGLSSSHKGTDGSAGLVLPSNRSSIDTHDRQRAA